MVDRRGQHKTGDPGACRRFSQASFVLFFASFDFDSTYNSLRCLHLEIWRFSCGRRQDVDIQAITLPLAHARGVIICQGLTTSSMTTISNTVEHNSSTTLMHLYRLQTMVSLSVCDNNYTCSNLQLETAQLDRQVL